MPKQCPFIWKSMCFKAKNYPSLVSNHFQCRAITRIMVLFCPFLALLWPTQHNFRNWSLTPWRQSGCTMGYIFRAKCIKLLWHHNDAIVGYAQEVMRIRKYSAPRGDICAQYCVPVLGCAYRTMGSLRCHNRSIVIESVNEA